MNISKMRQQLVKLFQEAKNIEKALLKCRGPFIMGCIHLRYTSCGKGNCKCMRGEKHGPFVYVTIRVNGKIIQRYAGKTKDKALLKKIKNYRDYKNKLNRLCKVHKSIEELWRKVGRGLLQQVEK
ncbi:MAG: DUF6788 family protein [Elusimicrobiota bacterium]|nr:DUF6788 family protein [Elusimicrobiota bacterium]